MATGSIEKNETRKGVTEFFYVLKEGDSELHRNKIFIVDTVKSQVRMFPTNAGIPEVVFENRTKVPLALVTDKAKFIAGSFIQYRLTKENITIKKIVIDKGIKDRIDKKTGVLYLEYEKLLKFKKRLARITQDAKDDKSLEADFYVHDILPEHFNDPDGVGNSVSKKLSSIFDNLTEDIIEHIPRKNVDELFEFVSTILDKRYKTAKDKKRLLEFVRIKVNEKPIEELIGEFEKNIKDVVSESDWSKFIKRNLFLIDPNYVKHYPELGVTLGIKIRKVDFGLLDVQSNLDIFEIKTDRTQLLATGEDRGNHYWSTAAIKAITQAEKYLYNAERNADSLEKALLRETADEVNVVRPRVILLMGNSRQLKTKNQKEDFRVLRKSLKNIEIVLYDELLSKLTGLKDKKSLFGSNE